MAVEIRRATDDDFKAICALDFRNFAIGPVDDDLWDPIRATVDLNRFVVADDNGRLVGAAGSYQFLLTVPGSPTAPPPELPASGVTWVSVSTTHRRQGILRRMMDALDELAKEADEPVQVLLASESGIYERFGYGVGTQTRCISIDRHRTAIHPRFQPEPVELGLANDHIDEAIELWERYRRSRVGEVPRPEAAVRLDRLSTKTPTYIAIHPDGYATYQVQGSNSPQPAGTLTITEFCAVTPQAHLALWNLLLSVDLVSTITAFRAVSIDDPLPSLLTDPRSVQTTSLNDGLWAKVTDPVRCFSARGYRASDRFTIGVVETVDDLLAGHRPVDTFIVSDEGCESAEGASVGSPDLLAARPALGSLLLGNRATEIAQTHRLTGSPEALARADVFFGTGQAPFCAAHF